MFDAHVLKVLISTPGDTGEEVDAVTRALHDWNADRAEAATAILLPRFWKAHAVPSAGGSGQTVIDSQLVDDADIVIAIFDSRLGQATDDAVSGTAHEIQRSIDSGKPVHVWFSNEPLPNDVDIDELQRLRDFKKDMEAKALLGDYLSPSDLIFKVRSAIEKDVHDMGLSSASIARRDEHAMPRLTVREVNGRDRLFLENKSQTVTAEQLTLDLRDWEGSMLRRDKAPFDLPPVAEVSWPMALSFGDPTQITAKLEWFEKGKPQSADLLVTI